MRLTDPWFEAAFFGFVQCTSDDRYTSRHAHQDGRPVTFTEAQGVQFWCPCGVNARDEHGELKYPPLDLMLGKGRPYLTMVPFAGRGLPDNFGPLSRDGKTHPRWNVSGTSLDDLSTTPSIAVGDPECWHGYITNGEVR